MKHLIWMLALLAISMQGLAQNNKHNTQNKTTTTDKKTATTAAPVPTCGYLCNPPLPYMPQKLDVLFIGNSFSLDTSKALPEILNSLGINYVNVYVLYRGGCSMRQHYNFTRNGEKAYELYQFNSQGEQQLEKATSIGEVMDLPVCTGPILDEKDKPTGSSAWIQPSRKIDQGLVYYGRSEDFYYTITVNGNTAEQWRLEVPFDSLAAPEYTHFQRGSSAGGTLVFIRAAYVTENRMSDGRTRVLMLSDGMKYTTSQNWYVDVVDYQGHEY